MENKAFQIWEFYLSFVFLISIGEEILVLAYYAPLTQVHAVYKTWE
jgi:hypothetical protein